MAGKTRRAPLVISGEERTYLEQLSRSRKAEKRAVILLRYAQGEGITEIHRALSFSRVTIYKCIDKALAIGSFRGWLRNTTFPDLAASSFQAH